MKVALLRRHDALLLKDLRRQPVWLLWLYLSLGMTAAIAGLSSDHGTGSRLLCLGGGFLVALGAEKLVTRRIRAVALSLVQAATVYSQP